MSVAPEHAPPPAEDFYARYYAEKIWSWIPQIHRIRDGEQSPPGPLRAMVEIIAAAAAVERRSIDRLWEDAIVDYADDWAVAYIAELVGARLPHALNRRGRRTATQRAIANRRRAGTPPLLERLIFDVTGWSGAISEGWRRIARTRHALDPPLGDDEFGGLRTPQGGIANMRGARGAELVDAAFDRFAHTVDARCLRGRYGRHNVRKLNVFLYRQQAFEVQFPTPFALSDTQYTIDPSGRDAPLFRPDARAHTEESDVNALRCPPIAEWRIEAPIPCRLLGEAAYRPSAETTPAALVAALTPLFGRVIEGAGAYRRFFERLSPGPTPDYDAFAAMLAAQASASSPKPNLIPSALDLAFGLDPDADRLGFERVAPAALRPWSPAGAPGEARALVDPLRGRVETLAAPGPGERLFIRRAHYGAVIGVGAGTHDRGAGLVDDADPLPPGGAPGAPGDAVALAALPTSGAHQIADSRTYDLTTPALNGVAELRLQAGPFERPYLRISPDDGGDVFAITAQPKADESESRTLDVDGLWIGLQPQNLAAVAPPAPPVPTRLVIDGIWDRVRLCNVTLDPGGERARLDEALAIAIPHVILEIVGVVAELEIDRCVVGPIRERSDLADPCSIGALRIVDSIVQSIEPDRPAVDARRASVTLERASVLGDVVVNRLYATDALVAGIVRATDGQNGCFRFSAASRGQTTDETAPDFERLPPRFEAVVFDDGVPPHAFESIRFGDPGYAQLSKTAPSALRRGAENGSEMGAYNRNLAPIKLDDLKRAFDEFAPVGVVAQFICAT